MVFWRRTGVNTRNPIASPFSRFSDVLAQRLGRRFYYGWVIVGVFAIGSMIQSGQYNPSIGVFIKPITEDFGWNRSVFVGALSLGTVIGGLGALFVGPMLDRFGPRWIVAAGFAMVGGGLIGLSRVNELWQLFISLVLLRVALQGTLNLSLSVTIGKWFVRKRGRATAVAAMGQRIGNGTTPIYAQALITHFSWRISAMTLGALALATSFLPSILLLRRQPEDMGLRPDGAKTPAMPLPDTEPETATKDDEFSFTLRQALRTPAFYAVVLSMSMGMFVVSGINVNFLAYLSDQGLSPGTAVFVVTVWSFTGAAGVVGAGFLIDSVPIRYVLGLTCVGLGLVFFLLLEVDSLGIAMVYAVLYGLLFGAFVTSTMVIYAKYFGRESLGSISGVTQLVHTITNALGPLIAAVVFDATGEYQAVFASFIGIMLAAAVVVLITKPPRRPAGAPSPTWPPGG